MNIIQYINDDIDPVGITIKNYQTLVKMVSIMNALERLQRLKERVQIITDFLDKNRK